ncbi:MAG: hypothetical protein ACTSV0_03795 [Candidatus Freyarchaeota archaeon]
MDVYRPGGVQALAIFFIIASILGFFFVARTAATFNSEYLGVVLYYYSLSQILPRYPPHGPVYLYLALGNAIYHTSTLGAMPIIVIITLITSGVCLPASIGLLYMKGWGRRLSLLVGVLNLIMGVILLLFPGVLFLIGAAILILGIVILWYLTGEVKYEFE